MSTETILKLGDNFIPVGAGRGISQTLDPISNGDIRRTINGSLIDLTRALNRKFESQVNCTDMGTPTLAGIWKGSIIQVDCIQPLRELVNPASTTHTIIRDPVAGSVIGIDEATDAEVTPTIVAGRDITFSAAVKAIEFLPSLEMMVRSHSLNTDEYAAEEGWSIDLEEV